MFFVAPDETTTVSRWSIWP